jgi:hypothetical protein
MKAATQVCNSTTEIGRAPSISRRLRVLVFPCGSEIGLELQRAIGSSTHFDLFGASSVSSNHGRFAYQNYVDGLPSVEDDRFVEEIAAFAAAQGIDVVFPAHDSVVLKLAEHRARIPSRLAAPALDTCVICRSKQKTYQYLDGVVRVPRIYDPSERELPFPLFLKPDVGQASRGTSLAQSPPDVQFYRQKDPSLLLLEYLPGREYTVDCFTDRHGSLRFAGARERLRISNGISVHTRPVGSEQFDRIAQTINKRLTFRGVWFFQLKETSDGELALLEIGPRVAGAMSLYRNLGVNLALLTLFDCLDMDVSILQNSFAIEMDQALRARFLLDLSYQHVYIDLDDTIVRNGKTNPLVAAFLYQCLNRGIKTHLLSRHNGDIDATLQRLRINQLFDSVVHVCNGEQKAVYIRHQSAIFIDDSHAERKSVKDCLGIPVFDVDAVESLLDWRM